MINRAVVHAVRGVLGAFVLVVGLSWPSDEARAQQTVVNTATVTAPSGTVDPEPGNNTDTATVSVTAVPSYDFCPAGGSPVYSITNGVRIWRYDPPAAMDVAIPELDMPVAGNLNGLMVDPVRNRMLFAARSGGSTVLWAYDAANGGWYQALAPFTSPDFPRAGMAPDGTGYMIAGGSATPEVWRITADPAPGSFGYSVGPAGNLSYDHAPTDLGSGDIAFDGNGVAWLSAGRDLYSVDLGGGSLQAVRQTRPILNGAPSTINWAGVAFAADGTLYVADNTSASAYYGYDPGTGELVLAAPAAAAASRDLASCAFPVQQAPELSVAKTLAQVNGAAATTGARVGPGDTLAYDITISNTGGAVATLYPGDVVETLPEGTSAVAADNDFTCSGGSCPNTEAVNVAAGASAVLRFVVRVDDHPLPASVGRIHNVVSVAGVDCATAPNQCEATTGLRPVVAVSKSADPSSGTAVAMGQTIAYTVVVEVSYAALLSDVVVTDTLGTGLGLGAVTAPGFSCNAANPLECTLPQGTVPGTYSVVYAATVTADAAATVSNGVTATGGNDPGDPSAPQPGCSACGTEHPVTRATVGVGKSANPAAGGSVLPGSTVEYTLTVTVADAPTAEAVTLQDTLGNGLTFGAVIDPGLFACTGALECVLPAGAPPGIHAVTYTATVDADATGTVGNSVVATNPPGGDPDPVCTTCTTEHDISPASVTVEKSSTPSSGSSVLPGSTIEYALTVTVANSATTEVVTLTDTLGTGLTFGAVSDAGIFQCSGSLMCELPAGTLPGTYAVTYTATVNTDATGSVGNAVVATNPPGGDPDPVCTTCTTEHDITPPSVTVEKSANPVTGSTVLPGSTIEYTLTVSVANSATTEAVTLTDTLGTGLTFGAVSDAGIFNCSGSLICELPAGTLPGTYAVTYTARIDADATGPVGNSVVATNPPGGDPDPVCTTCTTEHDITPASLTVEKSANPASGSTVLPGSTIEYTLTVAVANSATTEVVTLVDTLGTGLTFGAVNDAGIFNCSGSLTCELPAGTLPGTYAVTYTATVNANATGSVANAVVATNPPGGDPDPVCTTCTTEHDITPTSVTVAKSSNPASGSTVLLGSTIEYTLTVTVANSATTEVVTLTDTLGTGLTFGAVSDAGIFKCSGSLICELPAGTLPGTYAVTYTATVDADATGSVANAVVATNPPGGDPDPVCTTCTTEHNITPTSVTVEKRANPASGSTILPGSTIEYTLTVTVADSATTEIVTLADTLGTGLTFGAVTDAGIFSCSGSLICALPSGTLPGTYAATYTATVNTDATGSVGNSVVAITPPGGDPDPACTTCTTEHDITPTSVTVAKSSNPASGSAVLPGSTIEYTLTVTVANSATTEVVTLSDTLGTGLTFGAVSDAGIFNCSGSLICELPAGTLPGAYAVTYTATVDADATGSVANVVVASNPPGGDPEPVCTTCTTEHDITPASVTVAKSSNPASGSAVLPGSTIEYTLTVTVANSATTEVVTLTDTLGTGLTFNAVNDAGIFNCSGSLICELPAGTLPGAYAVTYTATVDADATDSVGNSVVATNSPGGDPDPVCTTCTTEHDITPASVTVAKSSNPASGSTVLPGSAIEYTLTVIVANSATTELVTLADTLGTGLTFGAVSDAGIFNCSGSLICELPAGTLPGAYAVTYTATVNADATGSVGNAVVATNLPGGDPDPVCTSCTTEHDITPTSVTVEKSSNPSSGSTVLPGSTIEYTLTVIVANSATTEVVTLSDTLGTGLTFGAVSDAGVFNCNGSLICELPAGTLPGAYEVTYTATVDADATGLVGNSVVATNPPGGDPDPVCTTCTTEHDITPTSVTVAKSSNPASGSTVLPGSTIEYTLTVAVANSATTEVVTLVDTLGTGLTFGAVNDAGIFNCSGSLTCELPAGNLPGTYAVTYTATVNANATGSVANAVVATNPPGGDPNPVCTTCTTEHDITPTSVTVAKSSNPASGSTVLPGSTIDYTLTVTVANSATTELVNLADTLGTGLTFGAVSDAGIFNCSGSLVCELSADTLPGTYTVTYTATVDADATGSVGNSVVATNPPGGDPDPVCTTCTTQHDITPTSVTVEKSANPANSSTVLPGSTIEYTLTVTVANSATTEVVTLADTLGTGLTFGAVSDAGIFNCSGSLVCELQAGTLPGTYAVTYTATVNADATGSVGNSVVATNSPGGDPDPVCTTCTTEHDITPTRVTVEKSANPANGSTVLPGSTIEYTLTVTVANSATTEVVTLTDTLGAGLTFGAVSDAGIFNCRGSLICELPAGTLPGAYEVTYTATVDADAIGSVANVVVATNPPGGDPDPVCTTCTTEHDITPTSVTVEKSANPANGSTVLPGSTIEYTLTVTVANSATTELVTLTDTLGTGLTFGAVSDAGIFNCSGSLICELPAGTLPDTHAVTYTATVDADATGSVGNSVVATNSPGGDPDPVCTTCTTEHDITPTSITVEKSANPASGSTVLPGSTIEYILTVTVANSATTELVTLTDTLGTGLTFGAVSDAGVFNCSGSLICELPVGTLPGTYAVTYTATVDADATGSVGNSVVATNPPGGDPNPVCTTCTTEHDITPTSVTVAKSSNPVSGSTVLPGSTIEYTLTVTVASSATTEIVTLTDTLGTGLTFNAVNDAGIFSCSGSLICELPAGTLPGTYTVTYTATVDADATDSVANAVVATNPPGGDPDPVCTTCTTEHDITPTSVTVAKSSNPGSGSIVLPGSTIEYTLTVTVANSATTEIVTLTDTLGTGLTFGAVTDAAIFNCSGSLICELPAGTLPGTYAVTYTATVKADATGSVANAVVATNPPGGDPDPVCITCMTEHPIEATVVIVTKTSDPVSGSEVRAGDRLTYTLTAVVQNSVTTWPLVLSDTLGAGLSFGEVLDAGAFACADALACTLPAGSLPGSYAVLYTATVDADAAGSVGNFVAAIGGGDEPPACDTCSTTHPLADPVMTINKSSNPANGTRVAVGDTIEYTLAVLVEHAATVNPVRLVDRPSQGLDLGALPDGCTTSGGVITCVLDAGAVPGAYAFTYTATVNADAAGSVSNVVVGTSDGDGQDPQCATCETTHEVIDTPALRITKAVGSRTVNVGDLVRYTLTVENIGTLNVVDGTVVDTPPSGFSYVEGSMRVADGDGAFTLEGYGPMRIGGLDIAVGRKATIVYLLRVGAGVGHGTHENTAVAVDEGGDPVSNVATAQVIVDSDPMLDDSLVFGTVFDDRDGDGWQDSAKLSGVRVQGGFPESAYVAGSTTIDRGHGPVPVADASAPLLRGIGIGDIAGRQSEGDPAGPRQVVIRQLLREPVFDDGFALTSDQGAGLRMGADGATTPLHEGEAGRGLNAAGPTVERRVARVDGGYAVDYVIANEGIDERGIPGARIASVEGLLVETDQFGRYHLADVHGGDQVRGRNFILKVDPATLPAGALFTTDNPLLRRVTPGIPVRFDFGVRLPVQVIEGGRRVLELELGEVLFAPESSEVRADYLPAIQHMAARVDEHGGGEVVVTATATREALAFARAEAVRDALVAAVDAAAVPALSVVLRTEADDPHSTVAGLQGSELLLGTVLFDTDRSAIRADFEPLLDAVAARIERMGGGEVSIVGHTDVRGSHGYNAALGLRRAQAVFDAIARRLGPAARANLKVDVSPDPAAPVGGAGK